MEAKAAAAGAGPEVPHELEREFSPGDVEIFKRLFQEFDADGDGHINAADLKTIMARLGETVSDEIVNKLIDEVDLDKNKTIEFGEFCFSIHHFRTGVKKAGFGDVIAKHAALHEYKGLTGTHHFAEDEKVAFTEHINQCLHGDPHVRLPIDPASMDLFAAVGDGILLCKLINKAQADTVDERALNLPGRKPLNPWEKKENHNLCINAAKAIGCTVVNVHCDDLIEGKPHIVLGLIWQIVKIQLLSAINLKSHPELVRLLEEGETLADLLKLPPETILLRWVNFHLKGAGVDRRVTNFGADIKDSVCYTHLLHQVMPEACTTEPLAVPDVEARATLVLESAKAAGIPLFLRPPDIVSGNKRLNLAFVAQVFNEHPGLTITEAEKIEMAGALTDDVGDTREERVFRMWINSLNIEGVYINNLFTDVRDGVNLLRAMDAVEPGIVNWRKVNLKPKMKFHALENCNYAVVLGKQMKFSLVGIGGPDLIDGNKKLVLALVWQLMRHHMIKMLTELGGGRAIADADIIAWANGLVHSKGKTTSCASFRDRSLADGHFLLDLLAAIEPRVINWDLVKPGTTDEERAANAKYVISIARKLGTLVFNTWEDITEVVPKMVMMLFASIMTTAQAHARK